MKTLTEGKIGSGKYANIYDMKKEMKEGKFESRRIQLLQLLDLGYIVLKLLEKVMEKRFYTGKG